MRVFLFASLAAVASGLVARTLPATSSVRAERTALSMTTGSQVHYRIRRKRIANQARPGVRTRETRFTGGLKRRRRRRARARSAPAAA